MRDSGRHDALNRPYRETVRVVKYSSSEAYELGEPEEVLERVTWYEADGTEITDPTRIAELERRVNERERECRDGR